MELALADTLLRHDFRTVELEFRVGIKRRTFVSDVGETRWNALLARLRARGEGECRRTVELVVANGDESSRFVTSIDDQRTKPRWVHKKRVATRDVDADSPWCIRTSVAMEREEPATSPPVRYDLRREKTRWSFGASDGVSDGAWRVDVTRVKTSPAKDPDDDVSFEVEVELVDVDEFLTTELSEILARGRRIANDTIAKMTQK